MILGGTYVRSEHRGGDFAAVLAVADVSVDEAVAFDGLSCVSASFNILEKNIRQKSYTHHLELHSAAITSRCCSL